MTAMKLPAKGPWVNEPDAQECVVEDMICALQRNPSGAWCGYVAVDRVSRLFGVPYDAFSEQGIDVHGGLTFSGHRNAITIAGKTWAPNELWWFGFDCAHAGDFVPAFAELVGHIPNGFGAYDVYRDINYAAQESFKLARQLRDMR